MDPAHVRKGSEVGGIWFGGMRNGSEVEGVGKIISKGWRANSDVWGMGVIIRTP